jgi:alkyl hydroperoxide reductase subunit AhpC
MAHTKGPWKYHFHIPTDGFGTDAIRHVVVIPDKPYENQVLVGSYEHDEANARLIASAPELLEACKMALEKEKVMPNNWKSKDLILSLEQVIAKAEGK